MRPLLVTTSCGSSGSSRQHPRCSADHVAQPPSEPAAHRAVVVRPLGLWELRCTVPLFSPCSCTRRDLGMLLDETPLFEPSLLKELDWSCNSVSFSPPISPSSPGEGLVLRPLCMADFNR
ncbi:unnamed protein product, partial [Pleuronectes platessa]